jgi:hypothetical protein
MKILFLLMFFTLNGALFAFGRLECGHQPPVRTENPPVAGLPLDAAREPGQIPETAFTVTGGFEEVNISSCDPNLLEYIAQIDKGEDTARSENEDGASGPEVIRLFRQLVQGYKYLCCVKRADGELAVFVIYFNLSGEFSLLESYRDTEIFNFFASFFPEN